MGKNIRFNFSERAESSKQETILDNISSMEGVSVVGRLVPHGKRPEIRRLCYIILSASAILPVIIERLRGYSEYIGYIECTDSPIILPHDARDSKPNISRENKTKKSVRQK